MFRALILEDNPGRMDGFTQCLNNACPDGLFIISHAISAQGCIDFLKQHEYEIVFLTHDLGQNGFVPVADKNTGSEVARRINDNQEIIGSAAVVIHSINPEGASNMQRLIFGSVVLPEVWLAENFERHIAIEKLVSYRCELRS